jgi:PAS domain S-box-containing protein
MSVSAHLSPDQNQIVLDALGNPSALLVEHAIVQVNRAWIDWYGYDRQELMGKPLMDLLTRESQVILKIMFEDIASGTSKNQTYGLSFQNQPLRKTRFHVRPAPFAGEQACLLTAAALTEKPADQRIELHTMMSDLLSQKLPLREKLEYLLDLLRQIVPYTSASIFLVSGDRLEYVAGRGLPSELVIPQLEVKMNAPNYEPLSPEFAHQQYAIIDDVRTSVHWTDVPGAGYIRSWLGIPLRYDGQLIGVLNLDSDVPGFYQPEHAVTVIPLARNAAAAISHAVLYEQAQDELKRRERLQDVLVRNFTHTETLYWVLRTLLTADSLDDCLPDILNMIVAATPDTCLMVTIFDPATGQLLHQAQSEGFAGDSWEIFCRVANQEITAQPQMPAADLVWGNDETRYFDDTWQITGAIINKRGFMLALRPRSAESFSETEHELIATIANQIGLAVENNILYNQLQQYTQHLERIVNRRTSQLIVERRRLQAILDATAEGIFYMEDFYIQYANPTFCKMVGYSLDDLYGKPLSFIRVSNENYEYLNFNTILTDTTEVEAGRSETRLRHKDGTEIYTHIRFSLVGQPGEEPVRMVAIARDISQERELYFQRARFIANAAHELRTPISSIVLRLHLLRRQPEKLLEHLDSFDTVTNYLRDLVEELLTLSRFERGTMVLDRSPHILQDLIQDAIAANQPFAQSEGVEILTELPQEPLQMMIDGRRIVQLIGNLVVNGINYNVRGGKVTVSIRRDADLAGNNNVIIEVSDDGIGIDKHLLPTQIFEPFVRPSQGTRRETGMGLALAREIAHMHGGTIYARSQEGQGSTFRIMLPVSTPPQPS